MFVHMFFKNETNEEEKKTHCKNRLCHRYPVLLDTCAFLPNDGNHNEHNSKNERTHQTRPLCSFLFSSIAIQRPTYNNTKLHSGRLHWKLYDLYNGKRKNFNISSPETSGNIFFWRKVNWLANNNKAIRKMRTLRRTKNINNKINKEKFVHEHYMCIWFVHNLLRWSAGYFSCSFTTPRHLFHHDYYNHHRSLSADNGNVIILAFPFDSP